MTLPLIQIDDRRARWGLDGPHDAVGWPLVGGGRARIDCVEWHMVTADDLRVGVDPVGWLADRIRVGGGDVSRTAAFLTSRRLSTIVVESVSTPVGPVTAVASVGLGNALRAGDPAQPQPSAGTVNLALRSPVPLTESALLETLGLGQEAKGLAMAEAGVASVVSRETASGTGTDCALVVAPVCGDSLHSPVQYAGKHTELGAALGRAALAAIARGVDEWKKERGMMEHVLPSAERGRRLVLVGGGARSGKSAFAESRTQALARDREGSCYYIATGEAHDDEMRARIARHRADRGGTFVTVEEPVELDRVLTHDLMRNGEVSGAVLVDCLTLWMSNLLCRDATDDEIEERIMRLVKAAREVPYPLVLVTNEVGLGLVPANRLGRRFRDHVGRLHQELSAIADEVHFAALGTILQLRPGPVRAQAVTQPPNQAAGPPAQQS